MAVIAYQLEPDFHVGQDVPQREPLTLPVTVSVALSASLTATGELVDAPIRRLTPEHAGTRLCDAAVAGATASMPRTIAERNAVSQRPCLTCPDARELEICVGDSMRTTASPLPSQPTTT
jgi:hypothetical protein